MLAPGFLSVMFLVTALYREYREIGSWQSHLEERGRIRFCSFCFCFPFKKVMLSVTLCFLLRPARPFFTFFVPWDTDLPALGHSGFLALRLPASLGLWEALSGSGGQEETDIGVLISSPPSLFVGFCTCTQYLTGPMGEISLPWLTWLLLPWCSSICCGLISHTPNSVKVILIVPFRISIPVRMPEGSIQ